MSPLPQEQFRGLRVQPAGNKATFPTAPSSLTSPPSALGAKTTGAKSPFEVPLQAFKQFGDVVLRMEAMKTANRKEGADRLVTQRNKQYNLLVNSIDKAISQFPVEQQQKLRNDYLLPLVETGVEGMSSWYKQYSKGYQTQIENKANRVGIDKKKKEWQDQGFDTRNITDAQVLKVINKETTEGELLKGQKTISEKKFDIEQEKTRRAKEVAEIKLKGKKVPLTQTEKDKITKKKMVMQNKIRSLYDTRKKLQSSVDKEQEILNTLESEYKGLSAGDKGLPEGDKIKRKIEYTTKKIAIKQKLVDNEDKKINKLEKEFELDTEEEIDEQLIQDAIDAFPTKTREEIIAKIRQKMRGK